MNIRLIGLGDAGYEIPSLPSIAISVTDILKV